MKFKFLFLLFAALISVSAQAFDPKGQAITVLIGFAPGGGTDNVIKPYLEKMAELGYETKIEYKPGAESTIAMNHFSSVAADGKTIMVAASSGLILAEVFQKDLLKHNGFELASLVGLGPNVLITSTENAIKTFDDFTRDLKESKKTFAAGSLLGRTSAEYLIKKLGMNKDDIIVAKYKGMGPAVQDVAGGHVRYAMVPLNVALPMVEGGKVRILAVGGSSRLTSFKEIPTFLEKIKGFSRETTESNWGIILPKGTPKEVINFYSNLFTSIGKDPAVRNKLEKGYIFIKDEDLGADQYKSVYVKGVSAWAEIKN